MSIHSEGAQTWVQGPVHGYAIRPGYKDRTPVQMVDEHLLQLIRNGQDRHPDMDALLDARNVLALEQAVGA